MTSTSSRYGFPLPVGSQSRPIAIDCEDEDTLQNPLPSSSRAVADILRRAKQLSATNNIISIDEDDISLDDENNREIEEAEAQWIEENNQASRQWTQYHPSESLSFQSYEAHRSVQCYRTNGMKYKVGDCVELVNPIGEWTIKFVEIKFILVLDSTNQVILRGLPYSRNRELHGRLECKLNEVCQVLEINVNDGRSQEQQALIDIDPTQILTVRMLNKTNTKYPHCQWNNDSSWLGKSRQEREQRGPLTCRWKMRIEYQDAQHRKTCKPFGGAMIHMMEDNIEVQSFRTSDHERRKVWRGRDLSPPRGRRYTFGDIFCGAGGTSRGAVMAGFDVKLAVDHWGVACKNYKNNFKNTHLCEEDIFDFINDQDPLKSLLIDILHLSPPCQFFAPCHTHAGKDDDRNTAALFSCSECVKKLRPRLVTLEETFGLPQRHAEYFNGLIQGFTSLGYSIQWRILPLVEYGLPQTRTRLIMIASCPGEQLPTWPEPTHGLNLKPFVTEAQSFRGINFRTSLHDPHTANKIRATPRSGNSPIRTTITCSSSSDKVYHYSGNREYTLRELACLQGFPLTHMFEGFKTAIKKQIGNAFPPCVAKVFFQHLRKWLELRDGVQSHPVLSSPPRLDLTSPGRNYRILSSASNRAINEEGDVILNTGAYNGDLEEEEAICIALQESRIIRKTKTPRETSVTRRHISPIMLHDSDEDEMPIRQATEDISRLHVGETGDSPSSASSSSPGQNSLQSPWDTTRSLSPASSITLDFSPSSSPSLRKRKFKDVEDTPVKMSSPLTRERCAEARHHGDLDAVHLFSAASRTTDTGFWGTPRSPSRDESVLSDRSLSCHSSQEDSRPVSFPSSVWKLPSTRATSRDWTL